MKFSKSHQRFANRLRVQRALDCPEEFLGPNWREVLNFWLYQDTLNFDDTKNVQMLLRNLDEADRVSAADLAWDAAHGIINDRCFIAAFTTAYIIFGPTSWRVTCELIGSHKILEQGKPLTFVPLFLNL
jgi:hypothetical protein